MGVGVVQVLCMWGVGVVDVGVVHGVGASVGVVQVVGVGVVLRVGMGVGRYPVRWLVLPGSKVKRSFKHKNSSKKQKNQNAIFKEVLSSLADGERACTRIAVTECMTFLRGPDTPG